MNEPVIEIVKPCEHGQTHQHETPECWAHKDRHKQTDECYCDGGERVRYSRQEAIDLMGAAMFEQADPFCDQLVGVAVDALLAAFRVETKEQEKEKT